MNDIVDDEIKSMLEYDESTNCLSSDTFKAPIYKEIKLKKIHTLTTDANVQEVIELMQQDGTGCVVITEDERICGVVTERDILMKVLGKQQDFTKVKATEIMTNDPLRLHKEDRISFVMHNMHVGGYRHIPIVDDHDRPISVISIRQINTFILSHFPKAINNIQCVPFRGTSKRDDA